MKYDTIFISDLHLGGPCDYVALLNFLRDNDADRWYLVGDTIDIWAIKYSRKWPNEASLIVQKFLRKARKGQEIILLPGNHDSELRSLELFEFGNIRIVESAIHKVGNKRYLILHGDALDAVINNAKWLAKIGAIAYDLLIRVNQVMNWFRSLVGLPYWSVSAAIKRAVKSAVNYISGFEGALVQLAKQREVDGIICGHIHTPAVKQIDGIMYLNCGDWVESRSALVEKDGEIRMVYGK